MKKSFAEFQHLFHSLERSDPRHKKLCEEYPHYKRAILDRAWAQIARIRERTKQKETA